MQCTIKKLNATKCVLNIEVPRDHLKETEEEVFKSLNNTATIPGFRKGKAPYDMFMRYHKNSFEDEVVRKSVPRYCEEAFKQHQLDIIDYPSIKDIKLDKTRFSFTAEVEVKPVVPMDESSYKHIHIKRGETEIKDKEIDKAVESIDHLIDEVMPRKLSESEYAHFSGYSGADALRDAIRAELHLEKLKRNRVIMEETVMKHLLEKVSFSIPESMHRKQIERLVSQEAQNLQMRGIAEEEIEKNREDIRKKSAPLAEKQLKIYYMMEKVIELEKINREKVKDVYNVGMGVILTYAKWDE